MKITNNLILIFSTLLLMTIGCKESKTGATTDLNQIKGFVLMQVGDVKIQKSGLQPLALTMKDPVSAGDVIITGPASYATIQFGDKGLVKILEKTTIKMLNLFGNNSGELFLENGQVLSKFEKLQKGDKFSVKTRTAVASVRGTEFSTGYSNGKSLVAVKKGKISLSANSTGDKPDLGKEAAPEKEKIIEEGKTAVVKDPVIVTKDVSEKSAEPQIDVQVRPISNAEILTIEKVSMIAIIPEAEKKTDSELISIQKSSVDKDAVIDKELKIEVRKEKIKEMMIAPPKSIQEIKEVFDRIDEITLYNKRIVQGAIINRGAIYKILTTNGTIDVPENEIKSVRVIK
jgi:hypothetical protein